MTSTTRYHGRCYSAEQFLLWLESKEGVLLSFKLLAKRMSGLTVCQHAHQYLMGALSWHFLGSGITLDYLKSFCFTDLGLTCLDVKDNAVSRHSFVVEVLALLSCDKPSSENVEIKKFTDLQISYFILSRIKENI